MGVYSTLTVSREAALDAYHRLSRRHPSDAELEEFLDIYLDKSLMNVRISDHDAGVQDEDVLRRYTTR